MKVAAVHSSSRLGDWAFNINETHLWLKEMDNQKVEFTLFPELNLSGYTTSPEEVKNLIIDSELALERMSQISSQVNTAFSVGCCEKEGERIYISQYLFYDGKLIGKHRKTHLGSNEALVYSGSETLEVFSLQNVKAGIQLCFETHFPELSYRQASLGAEILLFSFASPREDPQEKFSRFKRFLPARAYDNACFVIVSNAAGSSSVGKPMSGLSIIINPKGEILSHSFENESGYCMAECDMSLVDRIKKSRMGWFNKYKNKQWIQNFYE